MEDMFYVNIGFLYGQFEVEACLYVVHKYSNYIKNVNV